MSTANLKKKTRQLRNGGDSWWIGLQLVWRLGFRAAWYKHLNTCLLSECVTAGKTRFDQA